MIHSFKQKIMLFTAICLTAFVGIYCWVDSRSYIKIKQAKIVAPEISIKAKNEGVIAKCNLYLGKSVSKGEELFVLLDEETRRQLVDTEHKLEQEKSTLLTLKLDFDEEMKKYIEASAKDSSFLEPALIAIQQAQVEIENSEAKIKELQTNRTKLSNKLESKISTPFDGIVLKILKKEGELTHLDESVCVVSHPNSFFIEATLPVNELKRVQKDCSAKIEFPSYNRQKYVGKIISIGPEVINDQVQLRIEAECLPPYPGLCAHVEIRVP